ncbi:MAG: hypothetical protein MZV70_34250 [Desulfobacterales bacterium]|nr:hypothetical protein [Desulfobacterales bacterium]
MPSQDIVLGHLLPDPRAAPAPRARARSSPSPEEVRIGLRRTARSTCRPAIKVRHRTASSMETTVGRVLLYEILPETMPFDVVNKVMNKKELRQPHRPLLPDLRATRRRCSWPTG